MTAVSVSFDGSRIDAAEALGTIWTDTAGKTAVLETDIVWQNTYSISKKVSAATSGVCATFTPTVNFSATPKVMLIKCITTTPGLLNNEGSTGGKNWIGSNSYTNNYYEYYMFGKDTYPAVSGWLFPFIDPNVTAWRDNTNGTPSLTAVNMAAVQITTTGTAKSENVAMDALDYCDSGKGLTLINGTSPDAAGTFASFVAWDEGIYTNRYGVVISKSEAVFCHLFLTIGTATTTVFTSENELVIFPALRVNAGAQGIKCDLQNGSTVITMSNDTFKSVGRDNLKRFFDTDHQVDGVTNEYVTITAHGYSTGDAVLYSKEGGSQAIGLTDATEYFVRRIDADNIQFHTTRQNAITNTSAVNLTASSSGNGENHSIRRQPRTTFDFTVSGTSGTMTVTGCVFVRPSIITSTSKPDWSGCSFVNAWSVAVAGADFSGCTFSGAMTVEGETLISDSITNLEKIVSSTFVAGVLGGHAWKITGTAGSLDQTDVTFTGYGNDPGDGSGMAFDTISSVDATNDEVDYTDHGWTTGDPVYYSKYDPSDGSLGTDSIGLTDGALYYVRAVTTGSVSFHKTRYGATNNLDKINLSLGSSGEIHTLYSADAAVVNNTGGSVQINVFGGSSPSVRNIGAATTTVVTGSVPFTVTVKYADNNPVEDALVFVPVDTGGPYPFESSVGLSRSGTTVTVSHTGHGLSTNDWVWIMGSTEIDYWGVYQITVTGPNAYTYQTFKTPSSPATGSPTSTFMLIYGRTNVSGVVTISRSYSADQPYQAGWTRKGSELLADGIIPADTLDKDTGASVTVQMNPDE